MDGALLNPAGLIGPVQFEKIMRREMYAFVQVNTSGHARTET
jgi:hypothetical protein